MNLKIKRETLLDIVQENKLDHKAIYEEAKVEYFVDTAQLLEELAEQLEQKITLKEHISFPVPKSYLTEYDKIIKMLELDERDTIELSEIEVMRYIQDSWSWTEEFNNTSRRYSKTPMYENTKRIC